MKIRKLHVGIIVTLAGLLLGLIAPASVSHSSGFTVNSTGDAPDSALGDGFCETASGSGECTLRAAIEEANVNPGSDFIGFNIPGAGPHTIQPATQPPDVTEPAVIDGYTQPGASPNTNPTSLGINAVLVIELDGSDLIRFGLEISAGDSTVRGLVINRFVSGGIHVRTNGGNVIEGNFLGTDVTGSLALGNGGGGVNLIVGTNTIGGITPSARNLISGNTAQGVNAGGLGSNANVVQGNLVGTDASGTMALGNGEDGVVLGGSNNIIGGTTPEARNVISAIKRSVRSIFGTGNLVQGNFMGPDVTDTVDLGRGIVQPGNFDIIGGTVPGARNLIGQVSIGDMGNLIQGNLIGTDITGTVAFPSGGLILPGGNATNNVIGGTHPGAGNLISGDSDFSVFFTSGAGGNLVQGNLIGADVTGTGPLGNGINGVRVQNGSDNTVALNTIAYNVEDGVLVGFGPGEQNIKISQNSIYSNGDLGINLATTVAPGVVNLNDLGDGDSGPNNVQNFPVLTSANGNATATSIEGTLNSPANTQFTLEFFANSVLDPTGFGEGEDFLGDALVATDASGNASLTAVLAGAVPLGHFITSTATNPAGNTSEFSQGIAAVTVLNEPPVANAGGPYPVSEGGSVALAGSRTDPDGDPLSFAWDQDGDTIFESLGQSPVFSAAFLDGPSVQTITLKVCDEDGACDASSATVNISNLAPAVAEIAGPVDPVQVGTEIGIVANFTDDGALDTHSAVWDWGDGSTLAGTVTETGGFGAVTGAHTYLTPGVFTVNLDVTDDNGDSGQLAFQFVVVYDPTGGFVTGGGWIDSPAGAYALEPDLSGRANFGFVSKYKKAQQFQLARLSLGSSRRV